MMPRSLNVVALASVLLVSFSPTTRFARAQGAAPPEKVAASALERDVVALLAAVDLASDLATLQKTLAPKLSAVVAKHFDDFKAGVEPKSIESTDGRFVVVVIGDTPDGVNGKDVRATSDAELLLVVGGNAGARQRGGESYGGTGHAEATKGIGLGIGGAGGHGNADGVGGGGGGPAGATGGVGALSLGGPGGRGGPNGDAGKPGTGVDPTHLDAIVAAAKAWDTRK